jgi:hypothetical protein
VTSPASAKLWTVFDKSLMKQADSAAHSSGRSGGDKRVFDCPAIGALQTIATATVLLIVEAIATHP